MPRKPELIVIPELDVHNIMNPPHFVEGIRGEEINFNDLLMNRYLNNTKTILNLTGKSRAGSLIRRCGIETGEKYHDDLESYYIEHEL